MNLFYTIHKNVCYQGVEPQYQNVSDILRVLQSPSRLCPPKARMPQPARC